MHPRVCLAFFENHKSPLIECLQLSMQLATPGSLHNGRFLLETGTNQHSSDGVNSVAMYTLSICCKILDTLIENRELLCTIPCSDFRFRNACAHRCQGSPSRYNRRTSSFSSTSRMPSTLAFQSFDMRNPACHVADLLP